MTSQNVAKKIEVVFDLERPTKNTVRFQEAAEDPVIGTLYVQKRHLAALGDPQRIKVTIEVALA